MPVTAIIPLIMSAIQAAIAAAPQVEEIVTSAKAWISSLVTGKIITVDQQNALHSQVDGIVALLKAGIRPPAWTIEPDPK